MSAICQVPVVSITLAKVRQTPATCNITPLPRKTSGHRDGAARESDARESTTAVALLHPVLVSVLPKEHAHKEGSIGGQDLEHVTLAKRLADA